MPCHTAWHPSDASISRVDHIRSEVVNICKMIRDISRKLSVDAKYGPHTRMKIASLMGVDPKLRAVRVKGFSNEVDDPYAEEKIARASFAAREYGALHSLLTRELCRLCKIAENTPGKILTQRELHWWNTHRNSEGHEA